MFHTTIGWSGFSDLQHYDTSIVEVIRSYN